MSRRPICARRRCTRGPDGPIRTRGPSEVPSRPVRPLSIGRVSRDPATVLRTPVPGPVYRAVRWASWLELVLFAGLLVVWLGPGMEGATFVFGMAHGLGFIALALLVWVAVLRHEAPYTLLAATLTPVGPVGSVIAIHFIDRRYRNAAGGQPAPQRGA